MTQSAATLNWSGDVNQTYAEHSLLDSFGGDQAILKQVCNERRIGSARRAPGHDQTCCATTSEAVIIGEAGAIAEAPQRRRMYVDNCPEVSGCCKDAFSMLRIYCTTAIAEHRQSRVFPSCSCSIRKSDVSRRARQHPGLAFSQANNSLAKMRWRNRQVIWQQKRGFAPVNIAACRICR